VKKRKREREREREGERREREREKARQRARERETGDDCQDWKIGARSRMCVCEKERTRGSVWEKGMRENIQLYICNQVRPGKYI